LLHPLNDDVLLVSFNKIFWNKKIQVGTRFFAHVQTGPGAHPASCTMGTGSFPGVESGRCVTLTPLPPLVPRSSACRAIPLPPPQILSLLQGTSDSVWETLVHRRKIARICALFKAYTGKQSWKSIGDRLIGPFYLSRYDHNHKIRERNQRTDIGKYSFINRTIKLWKQLYWIYLLPSTQQTIGYNGFTTTCFDSHQSSSGYVQYLLVLAVLLQVWRLLVGMKWWLSLH
jgi:hypothetical protein